MHTHTPMHPHAIPIVNLCTHVYNANMNTHTCYSSIHVADPLCWQKAHTRPREAAQWRAVQPVASTSFILETGGQRVGTLGASTWCESPECPAPADRQDLFFLCRRGHAWLGDTLSKGTQGDTLNKWTRLVFTHVESLSHRKKACRTQNTSKHAYIQHLRN